MRRKGFTLFELMITVALVAVLALTLMPLISGFTGQNDAINGLQGIVDFVQRARVQASITGRAHQVRYVRGSSEFHLDRSASASCCCAGSPGDPFLVSNGGELSVTLLEVRSITPGLVIKDSDPQEIWDGTGALCFTPDGRVLDPATLQPFLSAAYGAGTVVLNTEEQGIVWNGQIPGPNGAPLPGRAWNVLLGYNGLAHWEPKR